MLARTSVHDGSRAVGSTRVLLARDLSSVRAQGPDIYEDDLRSIL
jgi:hypothetical protein